MKLLHITFQVGKRKDDRKFSEYYRERHTDESHPEIVLKMVELIEHLEQEVDAPTHWICTSHDNLTLYNRDFKVYSEAADAEDVAMVTISPLVWSRHGVHYEIQSHLPTSKHPWLYTTGITDDVKTAGQMVAQALKREI